MYLIRAANRLGVPVIVQLRMLLNLLIDALLGLVPVVGDYLDVLYKANVKNAKLIEQAVENKETSGRSSWFLFIGMILGLILIVAGSFVGLIWLTKTVWNAV